MQENLLKEYSDLKMLMMSMQEKEEELKHKIVAELATRNIKRLDKEYGQFTIATKMKYTYSPTVKKLEEDLKSLKYEEQEKGVATGTEYNYLMFTEKYITKEE